MEINIIPIVSGSLRDGSLLAGAKNVEERLIKRMEEGRERERERERKRERMRVPWRNKAPPFF